jgi:parallel beta-helix repeat protein
MAAQAGIRRIERDGPLECDDRERRTRCILIELTQGAEWPPRIMSSTGVASFAGLRSRLHDNQVRNNGEAGIYLGDSPDADAFITDNVAVADGFGLFLRDSMNVTAGGNRASGNCIGILAFNSGGGATAGGTYRIRDNDVRANNKSCPPTAHICRASVSRLQARMM